MQGHLPDCSLIAIIASQCTSFSKIKSFFSSLASADFISVRLFHQGYFQLVTVDLLVPCFPFGSSIVAFATSGLWVTCLEKAAAKVAGSYEALCKMTSKKHYELLTGHVPQVLYLNHPQSPPPAGTQYPSIAPIGSVISGIADSLHSNQPVICGGTYTRINAEFHLIKDHAYAIIEIRQQLNEKQVLVYNPWGVTCGQSKTQWIPFLQILAEANFVLVW